MLDCIKKKKPQIQRCKALMSLLINQKDIPFIIAPAALLVTSNSCQIQHDHFTGRNLGFAPNLD